jgi:hypothetical protein
MILYDIDGDDKEKNLYKIENYQDPSFQNFSSRIVFFLNMNFSTDIFPVLLGLIGLRLVMEHLDKMREQMRAERNRRHSVGLIVFRMTAYNS